MASSPRTRRLDDDTRRRHDRHRHWVPLLVLGYLLLLAVLWTAPFLAYLPDWAQALADHPLLGEIFARHGHLENEVWMHSSSDLSDPGQTRTLLLLTAIGFLLAYYLPLDYKREPLALLAGLGVAWVLGPAALALLLGWHLLAYLTFHAPGPGRRSAACLALLAGCLWPVDSPAWPDLAQWLLGAGLAAAVLYPLYVRIYRPLLQGRAGSWLQGAVAHSSLLYIGIALVWNTVPGNEAFVRPLGALLFFWQWERLVMYRIDLKDGRVPLDLSLPRYLATFLTPATFANFHWLSRIPLGYAYLDNAFLARDKNRIVLSGLWLITLSVLFFCLRPVILEALQLGAAALGYGPVTGYGQMVGLMQRGYAPDAPSTWFVLIYAFLSFYLLWTAVAHLKVGLWRLFGYDIEPYFQKPFLATNLVELWRRYSYYYREFLVQAFYYPVFLRCFRRSPRLRIFAATFAAAGLGNVIYHLMYAALFYGATAEELGPRLNTWPYYLLLGSGIALTQVYLVARGRKRHKPWRRLRRLGLDVAAVLGTFGFFVLIRPFHHVPKDDSIADTVQLILPALGVN